MPVKRWLEVSLPAPPDAQEELLARLIAEEFEGFQIEESCVVVYLPADDVSRLAVLRRLSPSLTARERGEEEWADAWMRYYKPTPIGSRLLIQPAWLPLENPENRAVYLNDPGMSFGTGLHASTRLCLEILESLEPKGWRVLDVGCGSGILGLCALLLGAESAVGVDIDAYAVRTALENALLNGMESKFTAYAEDFLTSGSVDGFDIIFSNIIADAIIPLVPIVAPAGSIWVASGIIEHRLDEVLSIAEAAGLNAPVIRIEDGWAAVLFSQ
ncbi:MAG: 50S ribosomal protein L11 methyltransferase [Oscillospiraceae bacterium]|nr:50S ribosomal protein L11 methyltransferase [Oscillospiraceae bacterium]